MNKASWVYDQLLIYDGRPVMPDGLVKATHRATGTTRWFCWYVALNDGIYYVARTRSGHRRQPATSLPASVLHRRPTSPLWQRVGRHRQ